jgi:hypothetical protein
MDSVVRTPIIKVEIIRPDYLSATYAVKDNNIFSTFNYPNVLVSYEFKDSLRTIENQFSLNLTLAKNEKGDNWYDLIYLNDLVFIYEFDELKFIGIVRNKRYASQMGSDGPERSIAISGLSLAGLLAQFKIIIDQFLYAGTQTAIQANQQLKAKLQELNGAGAPMGRIIKTIYDAFFTFALDMGRQIEKENKMAFPFGIKNIIDKFVEFDTGISDDIVLKYPIALSIYNTGENDVWSILQGLLTPPFYELFFRFNSSLGKYSGVFRQAPFESTAWLSLPVSWCPAVYIHDHNFGVSTDEIFTYYLCLVAGSGYTDSKGILLSSESTGYGSLSATDQEKWAIYGYRPLITEFKYFDTDQKSTYLTVAETMKSLAEMLKRWYQHNDEFLSGTITVNTIPRNYNDSKYGKLNSPRIGDKFYLAGGEFYIEEITHSWRYGGPMSTILGVSRGYKYDTAGNQLGKIKDLGAQLLKMKDIREVTEK